MTCKTVQKEILLAWKSCFVGSLMKRCSSRPTQAVQPASGSCVMERLSAVSTLHSEAAEVAENSNEVAQIDHFAEHFMGTSSSSKTPENANSDHTFHPLPTDGLQV